MSDPDATTEIAHWLSDNLADWLYDQSDDGVLHQQSFESKERYETFVNRCVLPHLSPYGVNAIYEFVKGDFDDEELVYQKM